MRENHDARDDSLPEECCIVRALLVPFVDSEASSGELARVEAHVASCESCARELEIHRELRRALLRPPGSRSSAGLASRVRARTNRTRRLQATVLVLAAAALVLIGLVLAWPARNPREASVPDEELLANLDVLEALEASGVEPSREVAQALLEAADRDEGLDSDMLDFLLDGELSKEEL